MKHPDPDVTPITCAWAEVATGPGWANWPVWYGIRRDGELEIHCLQPDEQGLEIVTLHSVCAAANAALVRAVGARLRALRNDGRKGAMRQVTRPPVAARMFNQLNQRSETMNPKKPAKVAALSPLRAGQAVIIRTVTHYYTGRIDLLSPEEIVLGDAAWIADTGRWSEALRTGALSEVEPYPAGVSVMRAAVIDVAPWLHALPREVR